MTSLLIKNGHVVDPANKIDGPMDILVKDGKTTLKPVPIF